MTNAATKVFIKPYPISAQLTLPNQSIVSLNIVGMTTKGVFIDAQEHSFHPMDRVILQMELPVSHHELQEKMMVLKVFHQYNAQAKGKAVHIAELHFLEISEPSKVAIMGFLQKIKAPLF